MKLSLLAKTGAAIFAVDQISKYLVVHLMNLDQIREVDVLPPFLQFRMAWNEGINFGLFSGQSDVAGDPMRWILILLAVVISGWIWSWARREAHNKWVQISAGLLIGGALGNVIDRLLYGAVADFLNMSLPGFNNPYSFNVADIAIFAGALGMVIFSGRDKTPVTRRN